MGCCFCSNPIPTPPQSIYGRVLRACVRARLCVWLQSNVYMKKINLSWNGFGLEGAIALGDALKGNSVLEELDVM